MHETAATSTPTPSASRAVNPSLQPQWTRLGQLYEEYGKLVYQVCERIMPCEDDARDAARETFATICRRFPSIPAGANIASWVHVIAIDSCLSLTRPAANGDSGESTTT